MRMHTVLEVEGGLDSRGDLGIENHPLELGGINKLAINILGKGSGSLCTKIQQGFPEALFVEHRGQLTVVSDDDALASEA